MIGKDSVKSKRIKEKPFTSAKTGGGPMFPSQELVRAADGDLDSVFYSSKDRAEDPVTGKSVPVLEFFAPTGREGTEPGRPPILNLERLRALARRLNLDRLRTQARQPMAADHEASPQRMLAMCCVGTAQEEVPEEVFLHAVLPDKHVVRLRAASVETIASLKNAEAVVAEIFGSDCVWLPWRRSVDEWACMLDAAVSKHTGGLKGVVLERGGLIAWGATARACRQNALALAGKANDWLAASLTAHSGRQPLSPVISAIPEGLDRRGRAAQVAPLLRGLCGGGQHLVGVFRDDPAIVDFSLLKKARDLSRLALNGVDCGLRAGLRPILIDPAPGAALPEIERRLREEFDRYSRKEGTAQTGELKLVLMAGVGLFGFAPGAATARKLADLHARHIRTVMQAEAIGGYRDLPASEIDALNRSPIEQDRTRQNRRKPLAGKIALVTGGASGIGLATARRLLAEGACVAIADFNREALAAQSESLGAEFGTDQIHTVFCDVTDALSIEQAFAETALRWCGLDILVNNAGLSLSRSLEETSPEDYDRQNAVMPRGGFLCARAAARIFRQQGLGGDIVYIASKNGLYAGPNNVAYGTAKAAQIHQARLVAAELADIQVRVNVVNPDAVVQGSGIFSGGWGADRAKAYGVKEGDLGKYYAQRTLLKLEILPEDIAAAVFTLVGPELRKSTGLVINVDGGFAPAMLR